MRIKIISTVLALAFPALAMATPYQTVERPREDCWNEQVRVQDRAGDYGGAIIGGLAGGILGHQVGGGNGKAVATALGAVTGAMVGNRMTARSGAHYTTEQRCRTVVDRVQVPLYEEQTAMLDMEQPRQYVEQREDNSGQRDARDYRWQEQRRREWQARQYEREREHDWERRRHHEHHRHEQDNDDD